MIRRLPIRIRITLAFAAAMAALLAAAATFLYVRLGTDLSRNLDQELRQRTQDLAGRAADPTATLAGVAESTLVERGETFAEIIGADGRLIDWTSTLNATTLLNRADLASAHRGTIFRTVPEVPGLDESARLLGTPITRGGRSVVLVVGATRQNRAEALASLRTELFVGGPLTLLIASLGGYLLAGAALRPVEAMRRRAATITAGRPGQRLPVPPAGDELTRLGSTLNDLLSRLEAALARERRLVADASHELRTPLAMLQTELELALRHPRSRSELRKAIESAAEESDRLTRLTQDLLLVARTDQGELPIMPEAVPTDELLARGVQPFWTRAAGQGRSLRVDAGGPPLLTLDPRRIGQALHNLLDNAFTHGAGPVTVFVSARPGFVQLHVTDEGSGFPTEFLPHAFERFARPDPTNRSGGGTGLGLSIVDAIVRAHGGTARAANRPAGGADVWLELPN